MERKSKGEVDRGRRKTGRAAGERESDGTSRGVHHAQTCTVGQNGEGLNGGRKRDR